MKEQLEQVTEKVSSNNDTQTEEQDLLNRKLKIIEIQTKEALTKSIQELDTQLRNYIRVENEMFV